VWRALCITHANNTARSLVVAAKAQNKITGRAPHPDFFETETHASHARDFFGTPTGPKQCEPRQAGDIAHNPFASCLLPSFLPVMPRKISEIVEEARQMPYGERAELVEQLIIANQQDLDPKLEKAWADTAMRRLAEMESGQVKPVPGDEVMARARKIIGRQ
jgi:putative addiction module component (TIGR02574 family)